MRQRVFVCAIVLGLVSMSGVLFAAVGADFDMKITPADTVFGVPAAPVGGSGSVAMKALFTTRIDTVQGWSFGVKLNAGTVDAVKITEIAKTPEVLTIKAGAKADFNTTSFYAAADLANKVADCDPATPCTGIDAAAFTQGVVVDFVQTINLNATTDFPMVAFTVNATGQPGDACEVVFTDAVGSPPVATVAVHGGASIAPTVQTKATISSSRRFAHRPPPSRSTSRAPRPRRART